MGFFKKHSIFLFLALLIPVQSALAAPENISRINKVIGKVSLTRGGEDRGPSLGGVIKSEDILETGLASLAEVSLNGVAGVRLLPMTKVVVLRLETEEPQIQLLQGNVIGVTRKGRRSFKVETPEADLRIESGQFWARYEKANVPSVTFSSLNGEARISPKKSPTLTLKPKQVLDINQGAALEARWASAAEIQAVSQAEDIEIL